MRRWSWLVVSVAVAAPVLAGAKGAKKSSGSPEEQCKTACAMVQKTCEQDCKQENPKDATCPKDCATSHTDCMAQCPMTHGGRLPQEPKAARPPEAMQPDPEDGNILPDADPKHTGGE